MLPQLPAASNILRGKETHTYTGAAVQGWVGSPQNSKTNAGNVK